jgi:hypothetical protein
MINAPLSQNKTHDGQNHDHDTNEVKKAVHDFSPCQMVFISQEDRLHAVAPIDPSLHSGVGAMKRTAQKQYGDRIRGLSSRPPRAAKSPESQPFIKWPFRMRHGSSPDPRRPSEYSIDL